MIDKETMSRLSDYFDPWDLVELLGLKTQDIIDAFEPEVEDALDDLNDIMGLNDDEE
jgi:hypothetical protein